MSDRHYQHVMRHMQSNHTTVPANPMKVIGASSPDVLDPTYDAEAPKAIDLAALESALNAGKLTPADAKSVCSHLSLGKQLPRDLLARVAAACSN
ncbi:hypothetical protein [Paraburkholderia sp. A1RO-5L]|uniref:hypothetical protein n=1 Tax=Paraburkholderia sp. A1RO-5L TaxID=3028370 RepID=UPI003B7B7982